MTAQDLIDKYGPPDDNYLAQNCMVWPIQEDFPWFPAAKIFINKDFKDMLFNSFTAVQAAGLQGEIKVFSGCYVDRPVRGSNAISAHAYGAAIDLNASDDPMVIKDFNNITPADRLGKWTQAFVNAMVSSGVFFGGNFRNRPDPMHWSMADM